MRKRGTWILLGISLGMAGVTAFVAAPALAQGPIRDALTDIQNDLVTHDANLVDHDAEVLNAIAEFNAGLTRGVIEINQTRAEAGNVTPGDTPGFPVVIFEAGSYRLTGNLTVDENTSAIQIRSPNVTLDLNGFAIIGPVDCRGTPVVCTPSGGTGSGISTAAAAQQTTVMNGSVTGMGSRGVSLQANCRVENLHVQSNAGVGIRGGGACIMRGNNLRLNGSSGIEAGFGTLIRENTFNFNGGYGLDGLSDTGYASNVFRGNNSGTVQNGVDMGGNVCNGNTICP